MRFGQGSISLPSPTGPPADGDRIQVQWWALPRSGSPFVMAEVGDFDISGIAGSRGAISVDVPARTPLCQQLLDLTYGADADLEVEIRLFGGQPKSLVGFLMSSDADQVAETGTVKFSGHLVAQLVYETELFPNAADEKGETKFAAKNAAEIVLTLVQTAKARGALSQVTTTTFNTSVDSAGHPWTTNTSVVLSPNRTYGQLLEEFEEQGLCEWEVTRDKELKLYVPGTRGTDRTGGLTPTVLHRGRDLLDAPRKHSVRDSVTTLMVAGKDGLYQEVSDASALARRGRRIEGYASVGNIDDPTALLGYAQLKLSTLSAGATEHNLGLVVNGDGPQPWLDVAEGDWVWVDFADGTGGERIRVQQVTLSRSGDELKASAVGGTLSMSAVVALNRRLNRLEQGVTVVGTSVDPTVGSIGDDVLPPAAPTGLVAESDAFLDPSGLAVALVTAGWAPVITSADGTATDDIAGYRVQIAYAGLQQVSFQGIPGTGIVYAPVTGAEGTTATEYTFPAEAGVEIAIQVMAFDRAGNSSAWSEPLVLITALDDTPPNAPSQPALATYLRTLDVTWDGFDSFAAPMPPDTVKVAVILAQAEQPDVPDVLGQPVVFNPEETGSQYVRDIPLGGGTTNITGLKFGVGWYAVLVAVDRAGNTSAPSVVGGPVVAQQLVNIEIGPDAVTRLQILDGEIVRAKIGDLAVNSQKVEEVNAGLLTAGTVSARLLLAGIVETGTTGYRMRMSGEGLRMWNPADALIGSWSTLDGSMLMTGTFQSGLSGARINILPNGTQRFYLSAGLAYSEIANDGTSGIKFRGPATGAGIDVGYLYIAPDNATMVWGAQNAPVSSNPRSRIDSSGMQVFGRFVGLRSLQTEGDGSVFFAFQNSSFVDIATSVLHYKYRSSAPCWGAPSMGSGLRFEENEVHTSDGFGAPEVHRPMVADSYFTASALAVKTDVQPAFTGPLSAADVVRRAPIRSYLLNSDLVERPDKPGHQVQNAAGEWIDADWAGPAPKPRLRIGPIADELATIHPALVVDPTGDPKDLRVDLLTLLSVAWAAAAEAHARLDRLENA